VQLPAVTVAGSSVLAIGGLDAADASVASIVRVATAPPVRARVIGTLPAALHDAAAATVNGASFLLGGGDAGAGLPQVLRILPSGRTRAAESLPAAAGGRILVLGGRDARGGVRDEVRLLEPRP